MNMHIFYEYIWKSVYSVKLSTLFFILACCLCGVICELHSWDSFEWANYRVETGT